MKFRCKTYGFEAEIFYQQAEGRAKVRLFLYGGGEVGVEVAGGGNARVPLEFGGEVFVVFIAAHIGDLLEGKIA